MAAGLNGRHGVGHDLTFLKQLVLIIFLVFSASLLNPAAAVVSQTEIQDVLNSLRSHGLGTFAAILQTEATSAAASLTVPASGITIFAPDDSAINAALPSVSNMTQLVEYHVATKQYNFTALTELPVGSDLPTLLGSGGYIIVTSNSTTHYTVDNVRIIKKDICNTTLVSCHAISGVLNSTLYGSGVAPPPPAPAPSPAPRPSIAPTPTKSPAPTPSIRPPVSGASPGPAPTPESVVPLEPPGPSSGIPPAPPSGASMHGVSFFNVVAGIAAVSFISRFLVDS